MTQPKREREITAESAVGYAVVALVVSLVGAVPLTTAVYRPNLYPWPIDVLGVLCLVGGVTGGAVGIQWLERRGRALSANPIEARRRRVETLTTLLRTSAMESADLLAELQYDIAEGMRRADEIREEIDRNAALVSLTQEQREAVGTVFAEQLGPRLRPRGRNRGGTTPPSQPS